MALKQTLSTSKNTSGGSRFPIAFLIFFCILAPSDIIIILNERVLLINLNFSGRKGKQLDAPHIFGTLHVYQSRCCKFVWSYQRILAACNHLECCFVLCLDD